MSLHKLTYEAIRAAGYQGHPQQYALIRIKGQVFQVLVYDTYSPTILVRTAEPGTKIHRWTYTAFGNGFPKAGTMMLGQILSTCHRPFSTQERGPSTHKMGWSNERWTVGEILAKFSRQGIGEYSSGHISADERRVMSWLKNHQMPVVLIYRDLRDVAVSYAHHVEKADQVKLFHHDPEPWRELPTHEDRIEKFITGGISDWIGLKAFWETYAPWLDQDWILPIRFEDVIEQPIESCVRIYKYLCARREMEFTEEEFQIIGEYMSHGIRKEFSPTFRTGKIGNWKEEFTPHLMGLAEQELGSWIDKLGYRER